MGARTLPIPEVRGAKYTAAVLEVVNGGSPQYAKHRILIDGRETIGEAQKSCELLYVSGTFATLGYTWYE